mgnify:CR=1 FL=1
MSTGPKPIVRSTWGGARPGAGRKRQTMTEKAVRKMYRHQRKAESEHSQSVDERLLELIYNVSGEIPPTVQLGAIKLWKEHTQARPRESDQRVDDLISSPTIYLPEMVPDNVTAISEDAQNE